MSLCVFATAFLCAQGKLTDCAMAYRESICLFRGLRKDFYIPESGQLPERFPPESEVCRSVLSLSGNYLEHIWNSMKGGG